MKVAGEQGGNALVLVAGGQALLVDCKNPPYGPALRRDASAMGGTLTTVVNTHHHADHTGGNAAFTNNLAVVAHAKGAPRTRAQIARYKAALEGLPADSEFSKDARAMLDALASRGEDAWAPTRTITTREELQIGGERVVLEPIGPAHTDNDLAVFLPGKNILHTGDLCFHKLHPFVDPSGGSDIEGWIARATGSCRSPTRAPSSCPATARSPTARGSKARRSSSCAARLRDEADPRRAHRRGSPRDARARLRDARIRADQAVHDERGLHGAQAERPEHALTAEASFL